MSTNVKLLLVVVAAAVMLLAGFVWGLPALTPTTDHDHQHGLAPASVVMA